MLTDGEHQAADASEVEPGFRLRFAASPLSSAKIETVLH